MKKAILIAALLVAAFLFAGCTSPQEKDPCLEMSGDERDICYAGKAVDERKAYMCIEVNDLGNRDDCYLAVLSAGGDAYCGEVENESKKDTCNYMAAMTWLRSQYCANIYNETTRQQCYDDLQKKQAQT